MIYIKDKLSLTFALSPDPQPPGLIQERWLQPVHVVLLQGVVAVVEEGELVVDLRDPRVISVVLTLSYPVHFLLKLFQAWLRFIYMLESAQTQQRGFQCTLSV